MDFESMAIPILHLPRCCFNLESCELPESFMDLNITSRDSEGNDAVVYSGLCNVKAIDYNVDVQNSSDSDFYSDEQTPIIVSEDPTNNLSEIWIDPTISPFVYNQYDDQSQEYYSVCSTSQITYEQNNTSYSVTKNVYSYKDAEHDMNMRKSVTMKKTEPYMKQGFPEYDIFDEDDFDFEMYLPGQLLNGLEEQTVVDLNAENRKELITDPNDENKALEQLMSSDIQSIGKQRKTIMYLGQDSNNGQTIQKIAYNDYEVECFGDNVEMESEVVIANSPPKLRRKKYQCAKCSQIFDQLSDFKEHMISHAPRPTRGVKTRPHNNLTCQDCGKTLKSKQKLERHVLGHGDPSVECGKCFKVFASKASLRAHSKLHERRLACDRCEMVFSLLAELRVHERDVHDSGAPRKQGRKRRAPITYAEDTCETDFAESLFNDLISSTGVKSSSDACMTSSTSPDWLDRSTVEPKTVTETVERSQETEVADSVMAKVINDMLSGKDQQKGSRRCKRCVICTKQFNRMSDLKRHLIEHVARRTLSKTPVNGSGALDIACEVCRMVSFTKIDRYKAHLREHANLTLYHCTFCDKSFSDSSNFSKHKKIHGDIYYQCDLCQRKFNSKRMLTQHMVYHNQNPPLTCDRCGKLFYYESSLNKHIKSVHTKNAAARFRCNFCLKYFKCLKEKWDHEWSVHNVRKAVVDCEECGSKFRKYSDLKRHCQQAHQLEIPPAKKSHRKKPRERY